MGYASGLNDAEFARKTRPGDDPAAAFLVGPQLHMLEGAARVTPLKMSFDREAGRFEGEFRWDHSGACQGSCRVSHAATLLISAAAASTAAATPSRSGLSVTAPIGDQSRVLPDQRFGFA